MPKENVSYIVSSTDAGDKDAVPFGNQAAATIVDASRVNKLMAFEVAQAAQKQIVTRGMWIVVIVGVVASTLGLKTYSDIQSAINAAKNQQIAQAKQDFQDELDRMKKKAEQSREAFETKSNDKLAQLEKDYRSRSDYYYDRSLVDYLSIAFLRESEDPETYSAPKLRPEEKSRLIKVLLDQTTDVDLFRDADRAIHDFSHGSMDGEEVGKLYTTLLFRDSPEHRWIKSDEAKKIVLIRSLANKGFMEAREVIRAILDEDAPSDSLLIAALQYVAAISDIGALTNVERIYEKQISQPVTKQALLVLGQLQPDSKHVKDWLSEFEKSKERKLSQIAHASDLAAAISRSRHREDDRRRQQRKVIAKRLFNLIVQSGAKYYFSSGHAERLTLLIPTKDQTEPMRGLRVDSRILLGRGSVVTLALSDLAKSGDVPELAKLIDIVSARPEDPFERKPVAVVRAHFEDDRSVLMLEGGKSVDRKSAEQVTLYAEISANVAGVRVSWRDVKGNKQTGMLKQFNHPDGINFDLEANMVLKGINEDAGD